MGHCSLQFVYKVSPPMGHRSLQFVYKAFPPWDIALFNLSTKFSPHGTSLSSICLQSFPPMGHRSLQFVYKVFPPWDIALFNLSTKFSPHGTSLSSREIFSYQACELLCTPPPPLKALHSLHWSL